MSAAREPSEDPNDLPHMPLVSAGNSDRCPVCGAHLAVDQRYCVECGTRRGAPRFALASSSVGATTSAASASRPPASGGVGARITRWTSSASLLLGLLILLVALGIGVLIGHNGNPKQTASRPATVIVNGGGSSGVASAGASTTAAATGVSSASSSGTSGGSSATKSSTKKASSTKSSSATKAAAATNPNAAATGKKATAAAAKSFAPTATKKSTLGGSCTAGTTGCSNGKQTGNLF